MLRNFDHAHCFDEVHQARNPTGRSAPPIGVLSWPLVSALRTMWDQLGEGLAAHREYEALALAIKQSQPQLDLQRLHLMADGALRHRQLVRRLGEALVPRGSLEGFQRIERRQSASHGRTRSAFDGQESAF